MIYVLSRRLDIEVGGRGGDAGTEKCTPSFKPSSYYSNGSLHEKQHHPLACGDCSRSEYVREIRETNEVAPKPLLCFQYGQFGSIHTREVRSYHLNLLKETPASQWPTQGTECQEPPLSAIKTRRAPDILVCIEAVHML